MFELAYPWVLVLLIPYLAAVLYDWRWKKAPTIPVASAAPFAAAVRCRIPWAKVLFALGGCVLILALARPRFGDERIAIRSQGIDMILAIDLSGSMGAIDVPKGVTDVRTLEQKRKSGEITNRLEDAKRELTEFVARRPNDRIGLIGFAPQSYNMVPPTLDHGWLIARLKELEPGIIGDMTGIASPLASGIHRLQDSPAPRRVMVLFTDGKNNVDDRITPLQAAELARDANVIIHTVGIGSSNAVFPARDPFGRTIYQPVADGFDEEMLKGIAANSGGEYFHAADGEGMKKVMDAINSLETTSFEQPKYIEYREMAPRLAVLALLLILTGWGMCHTVKLSVP